MRLSRYVLAGFGLFVVLLTGSIWANSVYTTKKLIPTIGFLSTGPQTYHTAFWQGLEALGYIDGKNIIVISKIGQGRASDLPNLAEELISNGVSVIVATNTLAVRAAMDRTATIPIVMVTSATPIESKFIESYSHPGHNVTGVTMPHPESASKTVQLLREVVPGLKRLSVLWSSTNPIHPPFIDHIRAQVEHAGLGVRTIDIQTVEDIDAAFNEMGDGKTDGLIVLVDQAINRNRERIIDLVNSKQIPAIYPFKDFAKSGGLISYGVEFSHLHYRSARYVDKIIKGAAAAELPVEQPSNFEMSINLKTAAALDIKIPTRLLLRADTVIE